MSYHIYYTNLMLVHQLVEFLLNLEYGTQRTFVLLIVFTIIVDTFMLKAIMYVHSYY